MIQHTCILVGIENCPACIERAEQDRAFMAKVQVVTDRWNERNAEGYVAPFCSPDECDHEQAPEGKCSRCCKCVECSDIRKADLAEGES